MNLCTCIQCIYLQCLLDFLGKTLLAKDVTHYLVPDCQLACEYLEILEFPEIQGIIFMQTVTHSVSTHDQNFLAFSLLAKSIMLVKLLEC